MSGSSLIDALIRGDKRVALIFGISDPEKLKGELRLAPPLFGRALSDVAVLIPEDPRSR